MNHYFYEAQSLITHCQSANTIAISSARSFALIYLPVS